MVLHTLSLSVVHPPLLRPPYCHNIHKWRHTRTRIHAHAHATTTKMHAEHFSHSTELIYIKCKMNDIFLNIFRWYKRLNNIFFVPLAIIHAVYIIKHPQNQNPMTCINKQHSIAWKWQCIHKFFVILSPFFFFLIFQYVNGFCSASGGKKLQNRW